MFMHSIIILKIFNAVLFYTMKFWFCEHHFPCQCDICD